MECHHRHYYLEEELDTLEITLCRKWQKGECIIPSDCAFRHYYTEEDERVEEVFNIFQVLLYINPKLCFSLKSSADQVRVR